MEKILNIETLDIDCSKEEIKKRFSEKVNIDDNFQCSQDNKS